MPPAARSGQDTTDVSEHPPHLGLTDDLLESILRVEAPSGFLSVYAGTDAADPDRVRIELKNQCARVEKARDDAVPERDLDEAVRRLHAGISETLQGAFAVAGFIPIGGPASDIVWVDLPGGVPTLVTQGPSPDILPVLSLIERFGEGGVVTLARGQVAVFHASRGTIDELARETVSVDTSDWPDAEGPFNAAASGRTVGTGAKSSIGSADAYEQKLDDAVVAEVVEVAAPLVDRFAAERGWKRVVWFGDAAVVDAVRAALRLHGLVHSVGDSVQLLDETLDALAARVDAVREAEWARSSEVAARALRERRPVDRVESVEEALTLSRDGRLKDLSIMLPPDLPTEAASPRRQRTDR